jgi:hypothetical protein
MAMWLPIKSNQSDVFTWATVTAAGFTEAGMERAFKGVLC